jgi:cytoskeletal protein CcmA (bactofilin family)
MFWRKRSTDPPAARADDAPSPPPASGSGAPEGAPAQGLPDTHSRILNLPILGDVVDMREASVSGAGAGRDGPHTRAAVPSPKPSVHSLGTHITGEIVSCGPLHIEGSVAGGVTAHELSIGPHAAVDGKVRADQIRMDGQVAGEVVCDRLQMGPAASLQGRLVCRQLELERGALLQGDVSIG